MTTIAAQRDPVASLISKGLSSVGWMGLAQMVCMAVRLGSSLILTRLLSPEAYGIIGPAMAVLTTLEWFCDLGVRPALVRHPLGGTTEYLNTGWWVGVVRGAGISLVAVSLAWPFANYSEQPALAGVLAVLALYSTLQALRSPGLPALRRELNYRALFLDEIGQTVVGAIVTLIAALFLHSVWAIVVGMLAGSGGGIAISYYLCPVRPALVWDAKAGRKILHFSRHVFVNTLVMALWLNADRILGLRWISLEQMGLYAVAWNLANVLDSLLARACDVYFSLLSRMTDFQLRAKQHERFCALTAFVAGPVLALAVVLAPLVIRVLYDARFAGAGILFAVLMARLSFRGLGQVQFQYLLALGDIRVATSSYVVAFLVQVGLLIPLTERWGALGLAFAGLASTTVLALTQSLLLWRRGQSRLAPFFVILGWMLLAGFLLSLSVR